jgi:hypothetical protein
LSLSSYPLLPSPFCPSPSLTSPFLHFMNFFLLLFPICSFLPFPFLLLSLSLYPLSFPCQILILKTNIKFIAPLTFKSIDKEQFSSVSISLIFKFHEVQSNISVDRVDPTKNEFFDERKTFILLHLFPHQHCSPDRSGSNR